MFKIESYVTPYISAYFSKYVKDFNPQDFQVSIWQGGATFTNVNLNLEAVEAELNLPVNLSSGHIHELKISVPWTKLTSEPIIVHVKTIEITLKLKSPDSNTAATPVRRGTIAKSKPVPEVPPSYIQNIMSKIMNNVKVVCENVILKYVEEDIVFSLNVKTVVLSCVNSEWEPAFVDLSTPSFMLRKLLCCSDLTVCLDKTNSSGKIETYLEPLLYKCSFDVRIMQQFHGYFAKSAYFTRLDFFLNEMKFSVTDEQVPMVLRLYNLISSLSTAEPIDNTLHVQNSDTATGVEDSEEDDYEPEGGSVWSWGSWAVDMVSQIPEVLLGPMDESTEPLGPCEFPDPVVHIGIFIDVATITFKGIERTYDRSTLASPRIRYLPFLKCNLQGITGDFIRRGFDINSRFGVSKVVIEGIGMCPCGLKDCIGDEQCHSSISNPYEYLSVGKCNADFSKNSLFDPEMSELGDVRPPADYDFKYDGHVELYTEEHMLDRTPGIAVEILDISPTLHSPQEMNSDQEDYEEEAPELQTEKSLCRVVVGPCNAKVCSGSIHRSKIIFFSAERYDYEPYGDLGKLLSWNSSQAKGDALHLTQVENSFYKLQFTIIKPRIEILAADHPDYDSQSHIRAYYRRRRTTTTTPLSYVLPEWPKLVLTCDTVDGSCSQPNIKFRKLIQAWRGEKIPPEIAKMYAETYYIKVYNMGLDLASNDFRTTLCDPFNLKITSIRRLEPTLLLPPGQVNVIEVEVKIDEIKIQFAKPHLMMCQIITVSCLDEKMSEHLSSTTILQDLPDYKNGDLVLHLRGLAGSHASTLEVGSYRLIVGGASMRVISPSFREPIVIFQGPVDVPSSDDENKLGMVIFQTPLNLENMEQPPAETTLTEALTPLFILRITTFKIFSDLKMFDWIDYTPKTLKPAMLIRSARMSSHSLYPMAPLYLYRKQEQDSSRLDRIPSNSSDEAASQGSASKSASYAGIYEMYRTPHASTHARTTGTSSIQDTSSQGNPQSLGDDSHSPSRKRRQSLEEEFMIFSPQAFVQTWERWIVKHLHFIKNTFVLVGIEGIEWCIPVREKKEIDPEETIVGTFVLQCPMICVHPQGTPGGLENGQYRLPVSLPHELRSRELYPLRIEFRSVCGFTDHLTLRRLPFLYPVEILLTLTMADKNAEGKRPTIASCVHSDIPSVRFELCYPQVKLLARLIEQTLHTTSFFLKTVPSLMLPPLDTYDLEASPSKPQIGEASTTGSIGDLSFSQSQSQGPQLNRFNSTSSLLDSSEVPCSASVEKIPDSHILDSTGLDQTTATFWVQMPLAQFQFVLTNSETGEKTDTTHQLVFDVEDILSHLDVHTEYVKWSFKVATMNLRSYQRTETGAWNFGDCLGVIMSCGEELTRDVQVLQSSGTTQDENEFVSRSSSPAQGSNVGPGPSTGPSTTAQQHRVLSFTFTRVVAKDFHWKSEVSSPITRWNAVLQKYYEKSYVPYEETAKRVLSEFDIKLKALDFLLCPLLFTPYIPSFQELLNISSPPDMYPPVEDKSKQLNSPAMNNNTLPLIYLETEAIRVFFKTHQQNPNGLITPDLAILNISSISMHSQSENAMHRTLIKPELYRLAEQARIIFIPGSPVEDRQYQIQLRGLSVVTCSWSDVEANSRRKFTNRSSASLKTMGENPAFEWNRIESGWHPVEVIAQPLVDRFDFSFAFSPAIVYERLPYQRSSDIVIGGHSFELNLTNDLFVNVNLQQLNTLVTIVNEFNQLYKASSSQVLLMDSTESDTQSDTPPLSVISSVREVDSGIESLHAMTSSGSGKFSEDFTRSMPRRPFDKSLVPFDVLVTVSHVQFAFYRLLYQTNMEQALQENTTLSPIIGIAPVFFAAIEQPHFVLALGNSKQKLEISIFDLFMASGNGESRLVPNFSLPQKEYFTEILFESLEGERNPKTGMRTSFCTVTLTDFWHRPCIANCELFHPVRVVFNQKRLSLSLYKDFFDLISSMFDTRETKIKTTSKSLTSNSVVEEDHPIRIFLSYIHTARVAFNQVVLEVDECPPGLPRAAITLSFSSVEAQIQSQDKYNIHTGMPVEHIQGTLIWNSLMVSTVLGEKGSGRDILMSPWSGTVKAHVKWYKWLKVPCSVVRIMTDPITLYVGPQNILALLQLYHTFGEYLLRIILVEENQIVEILEAVPQLPIRVDRYKDNLKSGTFKYIPVNSSMEFPAVYQVAFCQAEQTMTWRYPEPRVLIQIEAHPIPIEIPETRNHPTHVKCDVEYWDESQHKFCVFALFKLLESASGLVELPDKHKLHDFAATVWRIKITTPMQEQLNNYGRPLRPDVLAACLKIDSEHNPALIPKLKVCIEIPRLSLNLLNQIKYSGRIPEEQLSLYSVIYGGLTLYEQPFAVIDVFDNTIMCQMWLQRATIDWTGNMKVNVTDYSYLTEINVVDNFNFQSKFAVVEDNSQEVFSEIELMTERVIVKVGASTLHTAVLSLVAWHQVLNGYCGDEVDFSNNHLQTHVNLTQILICNDTASNIALMQVDTQKPLMVHGRQCYAYTWHSQRSPPKLKIGLLVKDGDIAWSIPFYANQCGSVVRKIGNKIPLFINISDLSTTQKKITISGAVSVANALTEAIEVGILHRLGGNELNWILESRSHGPSQLIDILTVDHFRFKFVDCEFGDNHGWSDVVTLDHLRSANNKSVTLTVYEERSGNLQTYNVWCSLVEEFTSDAMRYMIVISPFYRMRSSLALPTKARMTTARSDYQLSQTDFVLEGRGSELQINFLGSADVAHHLTIRMRSSVSSSKPTIPLLPAGPALENVVKSSPIETILDDIMGFTKTKITDKYERWPYIGEDIPVTEWTYSHQPGTDLQICFSPWIAGLPSVLIEAKPWALFVNMLGETLLFCEPETNPTSAGPKTFTISNMCVFSPSKIQGHFQFGIETSRELIWTKNLEFTKDISRTDIHHVNSNWKVPIDCISRLEIHGTAETIHLTLEARLRNSILVLTIRPTFVLQNRMSVPLNIKGFTLSRSKVIKEHDLDLENGVTVLDGNDNLLKLNDTTGVPFLGFSCDWDTQTESDSGKSGVKYLGLRTNDGPFWFVQLMKFEIIFNNMSANQGIHAKRQSIALHCCQPTLVSGNMKDLVNVTVPVSVSWTCKSGQVWISIADENRPQLVIHNYTNTHFLYSESKGNTNGPYDELSPFPQYMYLSPFSTAHYAFPTIQAKFPSFTTVTSTPSLILGKPKFAVTSSNFPRRSMIFPEFETLEWSNKINCLSQEEYQSIHLGTAEEISYVKVHIERLGPTYYCFIEQMSNAEVSAKDIRGRILSQGPFGQGQGLIAESRHALTTLKEPTHLHYSESTLEVSTDLLPRSRRGSFSLDPQSSDTQLVSPRSSLSFLIFDYYPVRLGRFCMSELRIILTDDLTRVNQKRELISFTTRDVFLELHTETEMGGLRVLGYKPQENSLVTFRVGDIQIDNALYEEKKYDFPVILLREEKYQTRLTKENFSFDYLDSMFEGPRNDQNPFLIEFSCLFGLSSPRQNELLKVWLTLEPFTINLEDQFINFIMPALDEFVAIVKEHIPKLCCETTRSNISNHQMLKDTDSDRTHPGSRVICALTGSSQSPTVDATNSTFMLLSLSRNNSSSTLSSPISSHFTSTASDSGGHGGPTPVNPLASADTEYFVGFPPNEIAIATRALNELLEEAFGGEESLTDTGGPSNESSEYNPFGLEESRRESNSNELIDKIMSNLVINHSKRLRMPSDVLDMMKTFADPIYLQTIIVTSVTVFVTMRMSNALGIYVAVDHSPLHLAEFDSTSALTTSYELGQAFGRHYLSGAIYKSGNPIRILGSMELLGSPGPFVRSVTTGVKDFIVYPYEGLFKGPLGFVSGVSHGCGSLVRNLGAGTLTSVTNWAWSMSRNIDRLTLDPFEQIQHEEGRRAHIDGFADGLYHGLTGFGIRLLGAVGGLTHHTMQSVIESGASAQGIMTGIGKGLIGVVTKPIGGAVELVAMTGQGLLRGAGWTHKFERQNELFVEDISSCPNALLKYRWKLHKEQNMNANQSIIETVLLVLDATESSHPSTLAPVTLLLTNENLLVMDGICDKIEKQISIMGLVVEPTEDKMLLRLKSAPLKTLDDVSLAKERVIDFVRSSAAAKPNPLLKVRRTEAEQSLSIKRSFEGFGMDNSTTPFGDFFVNPTSRSDFLTLLKLAQKEKTGQVFPVLR